MNSKAVKITVSLLLTVSLLCCSVSIFAADEENDNPLMYENDKTAAFLIYQLLKSWGIDITFNGVDSWIEPIQEYLMGLIYDYLDEQPSIESVLAWVADWWYGTDFWGNLVVNDTLLEDVEAFADWLVDKYDIEDNSIAVIEPIYTASGYSFFQNNTYYEAVYPDGTTTYSYTSLNFQDFTGTIGGYMVAHVLDNDTWYGVWIGSVNPSLYRWESIYVDYYGNEAVTYGSNMNRFQQSSQGWWYQYVAAPFRKDYAVEPSQVVIPRGSYFEGTQNEFNVFLANLKVEEEGDYKFVTSIINLPQTDESYTPGDGLTIIDGQPDYGQITIPDSITVDNLPAIVSTGTIENPEVDQIYTNIPAFFQMAGDTMNGFKQILFRMPDEVLIAIYAVLAVGVIFGFLRIMREH